MQSHPLWTYLNASFLARFLLLFACGWAAIEVLDYFQIVVVVFACSTILAFLLSHPVRWLRRFLPHHIAVFAVFIVALAFIGSLVITVGLALLAQGQPLIDNMASFLTSLTPRIEHLEQSLQRWNLQADLQSVGAQLREQMLTLLGAGVGLLQALLTNFVHSILIAVVTFFMLLDGDRLWKLVIKIVPFEQRDRVSKTIQNSLLGFFWGRLLLSFLVATSTFIVFLIFQVPYALTLAVVIGLFDLIPGIGTTLGIGLVILFLLSQSLALAIKSAIICIVIEQIGENFLLPRIMRDSLNINPVVMFFALIVGARIAGVLGIFLSIPIASIIVSLLEIDEMKGQVAAIPAAKAPASEEH
jgi:predicted PurR-regulated permease PerM